MLFGFGFSPSNPRAVSGGAATDADAQAFFTATGITDATQKSAVNQLVLDLKSYNIWTKMKAIYPMVGGSSSTHKYNLKDPRDLDAAFRLSFSTGWTHSSTGMLPNGANAWANTFLVPNTSLTLRNTHLSVYMRTDSAAGVKCEIGSANNTTANPSMALAVKYNTTNIASDAYSNSTNRLSVSNSDAKGFYIGTRTSINSHIVYKNGTNVANQTVNETNGSMPNIALALGCIFFGGATQFTDRQFAFTSIGDGLSGTEAANYNTAVQAFNTTLGRNV
jgi:hypothetical protein